MVVIDNEIPRAKAPSRLLEKCDDISGPGISEEQWDKLTPADQINIIASVASEWAFQYYMCAVRHNKLVEWENDLSD